MTTSCSSEIVAEATAKCVGGSVDMHEFYRRLFSPTGFVTAAVAERVVPTLLFSSSRAALTARGAATNRHEDPPARPPVARRRGSSARVGGAL